MRSDEFTLKAKPGTTLYLDMDGVLADFFAEYAKLAGVSTYRDIPPDKGEAVLTSMEGTDFFAKLPKFPTTDALVKLAVAYAGRYSICSSPLRRDHANSARHKKAWIKQHLNPQPERVEITRNKPQHAVTGNVPNILIDDKGSNIRDWRAAGGIGIKYQADEDSLSVVKHALDSIYCDMRDTCDAEAIEEVDISYSMYPKITRYFTIGEPYGKKRNLNVPHAKYRDNTKRFG